MFHSQGHYFTSGIKKNIPEGRDLAKRNYITVGDCVRDCCKKGGIRPYFW